MPLVLRVPQRRQWAAVHRHRLLRFLPLRPWLPLRLRLPRRLLLPLRLRHLLLLPLLLTTVSIF